MSTNVTKRSPQIVVLTNRLDEGANDEIVICGAVSSGSIATLCDDGRGLARSLAPFRRFLKYLPYYLEKL